MDTLFYPFEWLAEALAYGLLGLPRGSAIGESVAFFLYDVPKILTLLAVIVFAVTVIRSFFPPERTRKTLSKLPLGTGNLAAAGLGILTPF